MEELKGSTALVMVSIAMLGGVHRWRWISFMNVVFLKTLIMRNQWFVIQTLSGQEHKVKDSIEKRVKTDEMQDYVKEVLVPMEKVVEVRNQKKTVSNRKLWPGYVFVDMVLLDENKRIIEEPWYFIKETQGVIGFVGGEPPMPTPADEVESIKAQISESEETEKPKVNFEVGETIKINNGPFLNFSGVIEEIDPDRGKLKVTVNIFGRNTPVELGILAGRKSLINFYGKEDYRTDQAADSRRSGQSRAARRPALGQHGVNIMAFCKEFNAATKNDAGLIIPVVITVYQDKSFTFITKSPPASVLLKKAAGITAGSKVPNKDKVGKVTRKQVLDIVKMKSKT